MLYLNFYGKKNPVLEKFYGQELQLGYSVVSISSLITFYKQHGRKPLSKPASFQTPSLIDVKTSLHVEIMVFKQCFINKEISIMKMSIKCFINMLKWKKRSFLYAEGTKEEG